MSGKVRNPWRYAIVGLALLFSLVITLLSILTLLVVTESGSRRVVDYFGARINSSASFSLEIGNTEGNLFNGLQLDRVRFVNDSLSASVAVAEASWNPFSLLSGNFYLSELTLNALEIDLLRTDEIEPLSANDLIKQLAFESLDVGISIGNFTINQMAIRDGLQRYVVQSFSASMSLVGQQLQVDDLELEARPVHLDGQAALRLEPRIPLQAIINWRIDEEIIGEFDSASGVVEIDGDFTSARVQHQLITPFEIQSQGLVVDMLENEQRRLELTHTANTLVLPFDPIETAVFQDVRLSTFVSASELIIELDSSIEDPRVPVLNVSSIAELRGQTLVFRDLDFETELGSFESSGELTWTEGLEQLDAQFSYQLSDQNPLAYLGTDIPFTLGSIASVGELELHFANGEQRYDLHVDSLSGNFQEIPIQGAGEVSFDGAVIGIEQFQLQNLDNSLSFSGSYSDELDLIWSLDAPNPAGINEFFFANVNGAGTISGSLPSPRLSADINAADLRYGPLSLQSVNVFIEGDNAIYRSNIEISDVDYGSGDIAETIDKISVAVTGALDSHRITSSLESKSLNLDLSMQGGFANIEALQWNGELLKSSVLGVVGNWISERPVSLSLSPSSATVGNGCWQYEEIRVCAQLSPEGDNEFKLTGSINEFPLEEFNAVGGSLAGSQNSYYFQFPLIPRLPRQASLHGQASANMTLILSRQGEVGIDFSVLAEDSLLVLENSRTEDPSDLTLDTIDAEQEFSWEQLSLVGSYRDAIWQLNGNASLAQPDLANIGLPLNGRLESNMTISSQGSLVGTASANFMDLAWVEAFLPQISNVQGSLQSELSVGGTIEAPVFTGNVNILDGAFFANRLGVGFHDLKANLQGESNGTALLTGSVRSGGGELEFVGDLLNLYSESLPLY